MWIVPGLLTPAGPSKIKSPSDTTIYAPALKQLGPAPRRLNLSDQPVIPGKDQIKSAIEDSESVDDLTTKIISFIEGIRMQGGGDRERQPSRASQHLELEDDEFDQKMEQAKRKSSKLVVDSERHRATVNVPQGESISNSGVTEPGTSYPSPLDNSIHSKVKTKQAEWTQDTDDEFFHITCHIELAMREKIEAGGFVDLERLLPKPKGKPSANEHKMDLVFQDGHSYFVPASSENRINGIRRWEQAFRIYAAIYSQANPSRAAEIWQYVHVINTAASSYIWENVANYDYTFRQLMAQYPQQSWSKLYNQMWNLSLRDPIPKAGSSSNVGAAMGSSTKSSSQPNHQNQGKGKNSGKSKKLRHCWAWNKGGSCKFGSRCEFINRCSYCKSTKHGLNTCAKAKKEQASSIN